MQHNILCIIIVEGNVWIFKNLIYKKTGNEMNTFMFVTEIINAGLKYLCTFPRQVNKMSYVPSLHIYREHFQGTERENQFSAPR